MEISDTYLSNELFNIIKNSNKLNMPIGYQKFIGFIAVLVKGSRFEKLLLLFAIFGKGIPLDNNGKDGHNTTKRMDESSAYETESNGSQNS